MLSIPAGTAIREPAMWYFAWILGLGLACAFAILNAMWLELDPRLSYDPHSEADETTDISAERLSE